MVTLRTRLILMLRTWLLVSLSMLLLSLSLLTLLLLLLLLLLGHLHLLHLRSLALLWAMGWGLNSTGSTWTTTS